MKYHVIKSQFLHLYFSRRKRNIMIASSLQGLLICYGESLSGTLRTIECQKMSEVPKGIESISRYLSFKPIPPMTVSPHAIETINSGNSMEFYGDPVLPWAEGLFQESTLNFEQDHPKKEIASSPIRRMVSFFWNSHLTVMACLAFLIPPCFDETLMVDPPCLVRAAMARKAPSAICFFGSGFCVVYLCLKHHHHDVWLLGVAGCHYSSFGDQLEFVIPTSNLSKFWPY